jgi:hypothetical protein
MDVLDGRDAALRLVIRDRLRGGLLPTVTGRVVAGLGDGGLCVACRQPIAKGQAEYKPEDASGLMAHPRCFAIWLVESQIAGGERLRLLNVPPEPPGRVSA